MDAVQSFTGFKRSIDLEPSSFSSNKVLKVLPDGFIESNLPARPFAEEISLSSEVEVLSVNSEESFEDLTLETANKVQGVFENEFEPSIEKEVSEIENQVSLDALSRLRSLIEEERFLCENSPEFFSLINCFYQ